MKRLLIILWQGFERGLFYNIIIVIDHLLQK